ncbi:hypothetical protein PFISCL1PPCAC_25520, partial [Pristionchus fissidentatus]
SSKRCLKSERTSCYSPSSLLPSHCSSRVELEVLVTPRVSIDSPPFSLLKNVRTAASHSPRSTTGECER